MLIYLSIDHQTLVIFLGADVGWCSTIHERMFLLGISSILHCCSCTFIFTCNCTTLSHHCSCTCGLWGISSILHCCSCTFTSTSTTLSHHVLVHVLVACRGISSILFVVLVLVLVYIIPPLFICIVLASSQNKINTIVIAILG